MTRQKLGQSPIDKTRASFGVRHVQIILFFTGIFTEIMIRTSVPLSIVVMTDGLINTKSNAPICNWKNINVIISSFYREYLVLQVVAEQMGKNYGPRWILFGAMSNNACATITLMNFILLLRINLETIICLPTTEIIFQYSLEWPAFFHLFGDWFSYSLQCGTSSRRDKLHERSCFFLSLSEPYLFLLFSLDLFPYGVNISCVPVIYVYGLQFDFLIERHYLSRLNSRMLFEALSHYGGEISLIILAFLDASSAPLSIFMFVLPSAFVAALVFGYGVNSIDFSPGFSGILHGFPSSVSCISALAAPLCVRYVVPDLIHKSMNAALTLIIPGTVFLIFASAETSGRTRSQMGRGIV
ncbi:uncharacterized transporter slc-17.2-like [Euwallacea similis]|uniref:uncharacterized transporter slc-17.2-like n=1 Tax=Euwallacea similis TaxID=1736056 RepID=UPI00344D9995